jgi:hypothetical protein
MGWVTLTGAPNWHFEKEAAEQGIRRFPAWSASQIRSL